jgi:hypothetical protein
MGQARRRVSAQLAVSVDEPVRLTVQMALFGTPPERVEESLYAICDGRPVEVCEVVVPGAGRVHVCHPPPGRLEIRYDAAIDGAADAPVVSNADRISYRRPSRYAESDRLAPMAHAEFLGITDPGELLAAVSSWVGSRPRYVPGSSGPAEARSTRCSSARACAATTRTSSSLCSARWTCRRASPPSMPPVCIRWTSTR